MRMQPGEVFDGGLNFGNLSAELAGDLRITVHLQVLEMLLDELALQLKIVIFRAGWILLDGIQLKQETFLEVAGAAAGRLERLHWLQGFGRVLQAGTTFGLLLDLSQLGAETPFAVDEIDDRLAGVANPIGARDKRPLAKQYSRQRLAAGGGVGH